jgi:hypothetical protein
MSSDIRGLASADEKTNERVAKAKEGARAQNKEGLLETGRRGERQFLNTESICQRLAKGADKSKIRRKATEQNSWSHFRVLHIFFLRGDEEFRIASAIALNFSC